MNFFDEKKFNRLKVDLYLIFFYLLVNIYFYKFWSHIRFYILTQIQTITLFCKKWQLVLFEMMFRLKKFTTKAKQLFWINILDCENTLSVTWQIKQDIIQAGGKFVDMFLIKQQLTPYTFC
eukprot:TRINITY_DN23349_c0_g2_i2.p3 TRINITY_DN23349_c0_g2~~TRINITY_DN23349_c0_g2_i2.p3  ORF type:complete len:121 (-),score=7.62 TRINITY_DN23349_c0_g2_i2:763-1125(-)